MNTLDWFFIACFGFSCMAVGCSLGSILVLRQVEKMPKPKEAHELSSDELSKVLGECIHETWVRAQKMKADKAARREAEEAELPEAWPS